MAADRLPVVSRTTWASPLGTRTLAVTFGGSLARSTQRLAVLPAFAGDQPADRAAGVFGPAELAPWVRPQD